MFRSLKLTFVFAPRRAIVWSAKVNSLRPSHAGVDSITIANAFADCDCGVAPLGGEPSFTSLTTCVTRASFNCAASKQVAVTMKTNEQTAR